MAPLVERSAQREALSRGPFGSPRQPCSPLCVPLDDRLRDLCRSHMRRGLRQVTARSQGSCHPCIREGRLGLPRNDWGS